MFKTAFKSAIITILSVMIVSVLSYIFNIQNRSLSLLQFVLFGTGIYISHYFYKKEFHHLKYKEGFFLGLNTTFLLSLFYGIITYISLSAESGKIMDIFKESVIASLKDKNFSDSEIQSFMNNISRYLTPINIGLFICSVVFFMGMFLTSIISIFTKNKKYEE